MATPDFSLTAPKLPLSTGIPAGPAAERNDRSGSAGSSSRPRGKFARRGAGSGRLGVRGRAEDGDEMMGEASHAGPSKKTRSTGNTNHVRASPLDRGNSDAGPSSIRRPSAMGTARRGAPGRSSSEPRPKTATRTFGAGKGAIAILKEFLGKRYDTETKLLNLENLADDEAFTKNNLIPPGQKSSSRSSAAPAMWKLVATYYPDTASLSLANNKLADLKDLAMPALVAALPNLQNLSLKSNQISDIKVLSSIAPEDSTTPGFGCLRELLLEGNPLREEAVAAGNIQAYTSELARRFPTLSALDGVALEPTAAPKPVAPPKATPLGSALKQKAVPARYPMGIKPGLSDESRDVVSAFLTKFFSLFDIDRSSLAHIYTPNSTFALTTNSTIQHRSWNSKNCRQLPNQGSLRWKEYWDKSRNVKAIGSNSSSAVSDKVNAALHVGTEKIISIMQSLPGSSHPLTDPGKFLVDAMQQPNVLSDGGPTLLVMVHGEMLEEPGMGVRSFDRTWILAPAAPGSPAQANGWPCVVLSENLTLRNYAEPSAWAEDAILVDDQLGPSAPAQPDSALTPEQQAMVKQLQTSTRLNDAFSIQCLSESGWSLEKALAMFQSVASNIPPEAFIPA